MIKCRRKQEVRLGVGHKVVSVEIIVVEELLWGVDVVVDTDIVNQMGGVSIRQNKLT